MHFLYGTGKLILPVLSFGKWRADIRKSKANAFSGLPFWRKEQKEGILYFSFEGSILFGTLIWMIIIIVVSAVL